MKEGDINTIKNMCGSFMCFRKDKEGWKAVCNGMTYDEIICELSKTLHSLLKVNDRKKVREDLIEIIDKGE